VDRTSRAQGSGRRVWIFQGEASRFASGVFPDATTGLEWIAKHGLTGILTEYEVGDGCYDLALGKVASMTPSHITARLSTSPASRPGSAISTFATASPTPEPPAQR
jgi:hypothetical protein